METIPAAFGDSNFAAVDLGRKDRNGRLADLLDRMVRHPGGSLPDKLNQPADLRAFYRLMNRPEVTHAVLLGGHAEHTRRLIAAVPADTVVLRLHDATELDFTSKSARSVRARTAATSATTAWPSAPTPARPWA